MHVGEVSTIRTITSASRTSISFRQCLTKPSERNVSTTTVLPLSFILFPLLASSSSSLESLNNIPSTVGPSLQSTYRLPCVDPVHPCLVSCRQGSNPLSVNSSQTRSNSSSSLLYARQTHSFENQSRLSTMSTSLSSSKFEPSNSSLSSIRTIPTSQSSHPTSKLFVVYFHSTSTVFSCLGPHVL